MGEKESTFVGFLQVSMRDGLEKTISFFKLELEQEKKNVAEGEFRYSIMKDKDFPSDAIV